MRGQRGGYSRLRLPLQMLGKIEDSVKLAVHVYTYV